MPARTLEIAVAVGTVLLALVTAWVAFDTHRLAQSTTLDERLKTTVIVLRECATGTSSDARSGDSIVTFEAKDREGFDTDDRLSRDEFSQFMTSSADDYVRCEIINAGLLPLLNVQIAMDADIPGKGTVRVASPVFRVIEPSSRRILWFTSDSTKPIILHSPNKVRYSSFAAEGLHEASLTVATLEPILNDRWTIRKNKDVQEDLDQRETRPF